MNFAALVTLNLKPSYFQFEDMNSLRKVPSRILDRLRRSSGWGVGRKGRDEHEMRGVANGGAAGDDEPPLLTEQDHKELMSLLNQNISMDFILEMKEAFQLFDKVGFTTKLASYTYI